MSNDRGMKLSFLLIKFFCLLFLTSYSTVYGENRQAILVGQPNVQMNRADFYQEQIRKLTIQIITQRGGYDFFLANVEMEEMSMQLNQLKIDTGPVEGSDKYFINIDQISGRTGRPIRQSWSINVPERFFLLQVRINLLEALYGKMVARAERERLAQLDGAIENYLVETGQIEEPAEVEVASTSEGEKKSLLMRLQTIFQSLLGE